MTTEIHPTAVVAPTAELGADVTIGPHTVVGAHVRIGDRTRVGPQVVIAGATTLGQGNRILGQANIGGEPQDLSYEHELTHLDIGDRNTIREFVTINRGTVKGGGETRMGSDCLLMACCHVAHDCVLGDRVLLANNVLLAGHVEVGDGAIVNGAAAAHQFVTIGRHAYVGGMTRMIHDVPPFMILEGHPARVRKVNVVGLERAGFESEEIDQLRDAFRRVYRSGEPRQRILAELEAAETGPLVQELVRALRRAEQGHKGRHREALRTEFAEEGAQRFPGEPRNVGEVGA